MANFSKYFKTEVKVTCDHCLGSQRYFSEKTSDINKSLKDKGWIEIDNEFVLCDGCKIAYEQNPEGWKQRFR